MPVDLTIFTAQYLVFLTGALAVVILALRLWSQPRLVVVRWLVAAGLVLVLSYVLAQVGAMLYTDPRPFTTSGVPPLIAHAPDNGFPSDHALLAAALVALVALVDWRWALPLALLVVLVVLVDWARVGTGLHHPVDVVGSSVCVAVAFLIAWPVALLIVRWLTPRLPATWSDQRLLDRRSRKSR